MEYSDGEDENDIEVIDDLLGPDDLFNDEPDEDGGEEQNVHNEEEPQEKKEKDSKEVEKKIKPRKKSGSKLNYNNLSGENGLSALKQLFKNFKFKGNGHEKEDLSKIMGILQQWMCFKLCPSYDFESCMMELEQLGRKKINQVLLQKFRLGMDEWGCESKAVIENNLPDDNVEVSEKNEFDLLLEEEMANIRSDDELSQNEIPNYDRQNTQMDAEVTLTSEQLERIARNRKLAEERRLKRLSERHEMMDVSNDKMGDEEISVEGIHLEEEN